MNIIILSNESLQDLHALIREALEMDDAAPKGEKPFGLRDHPDWKKQADEYEAEMAFRRVWFRKIDWTLNSH